jgi:hypothetical protein
MVGPSCREQENPRSARHERKEGIFFHIPRQNSAENDCSYARADFANFSTGTVGDCQIDLRPYPKGRKGRTRLVTTVSNSGSNNSRLALGAAGLAVVVVVVLAGFLLGAVPD